MKCDRCGRDTSCLYDVIGHGYTPENGREICRDCLNLLARKDQP